MEKFQPQMLQPSNIFNGIKTVKMPELLPLKENDQFWYFSFDSYASLVKRKINQIQSLDDESKDYLLELINFMQSRNSNEKNLKKSYTDKVKKTLQANDIVKNFGEILGPFYARNLLIAKERENASYIVFPERQNYEIYDFFLRDGKYYGFSSKAYGTQSNPMAISNVMIKVEKLKKEAKNNPNLKYIKNELNLLSLLGGSGSMFTGISNAFGYLIEQKKIDFININQAYNFIRNKKHGSDLDCLKPIFSSFCLSVRNQFW